ncbi:MAG TPA: hypothetical protein VF852_06900, partial [Pseudolabrys sp.]
CCGKSRLAKFKETVKKLTRHLLAAIKSIEPEIAPAFIENDDLRVSRADTVAAIHGTQATC